MKAIYITIVSLALLVPSVVILILFFTMGFLYGSFWDAVLKWEEQMFVESCRKIRKVDNFRRIKFWHHFRKAIYLILALPAIGIRSLSRAYFGKLGLLMKSFNTAS